jgi:uncharacterized protein YqgV (UPF0045/DUF77 family)
MLLAEISMWPMDKGESVGAYGPLGTSIEGEWDDVMGVLKQCFELLSKDSNRIACTVKMDWRKGKSGMLDSKVRSVEQKLGRKLKT